MARRHRPLWYLLAAPALIACMLTPPIARASVDVLLTVKDDAGVARTNDVVTSGVPIPLADAGSTSWALFDGSTEIPVRAKVLAGVRTPWVLLDFQSSLGVSESRTYRLLSQASTATHPKPLVITETASTITVRTGRVQFEIGKTTFNLFDALWWDADNNGTFASSERVVVPTTSDNLPLVDDSGDATYAGRGTPTSIGWEDQNSLRATLRIDGCYGGPTNPILRYRTRITFHAGQTFATVQHLVRNSYAANERNVKVQSAQLRLASTSTISQAARSGDMLWMNPSNGQARVELIPASHRYSTGPNTEGDGTIDVAANGGMVIGDWSYHGATVRFDFEPGLTALNKSDRAKQFTDRLMARAPAAWYSDRGAFGTEKFGTYDDEKAAYTQWNWTWPNPSNDFADEHSATRPTAAYYPNWAKLHPRDPEADDVWMHLLMWARTGLRTYLDRADGWARYASWEATFRTDGFPYAWDNFWDNPQVARPVANIGDLSAADLLYIANDIKPRKEVVAHLWNGGLVDYYYLTGDREALGAAIDMAEKATRFQAARVAGTLIGSPSGGMRFEARAYLTALRAWEATADAQWRTHADHIRDLFLQSLRYDLRGFYFGFTSEMGYDEQDPPVLFGTRFPNGRYTSPLQLSTLVQPFYLDYLLTSDPTTKASLRDRLVALASFARQYGFKPATGFSGEDIVVDSPNSGDVLHLSNAVFRKNDLTHPYSLSAASHDFVDALTVAYRLTGDRKNLVTARMLWDRASKGHTEDTRYASATQVGHFVNSMEAWGVLDWLLYINNGELTSVNSYFYDAARVDFDAPARVTNLSVDCGRTTAVVAWTAPADTFNLASVVLYDLRYSGAPISEAIFAQLPQVTTSTPSAPGLPECVELSGLPMCTTYYFAVKSKDTAGNWSMLSNDDFAQTSCTVPALEVYCGNELRSGEELPETRTSVPHGIEFTVASANPASNPASITFGVPRDFAGNALRVGIHDLSGRLVRVLQEGPAVPGRFNRSWDLRASDGQYVPGGVYFVRMRLGGEVRARKLILVR